MNETLKKLLASGFIVITGGLVYWNFPDNDPMCLEYNKEKECIDERTKAQVCEDMLREFVIQADNMKSETPDNAIKKLKPQEMKIWDIAKKNGCPPPNGVYDISDFVRTPEYVYANLEKKNERKAELSQKFKENSINFLEKREAIGILQYEGNALIKEGVTSIDDLIINSLEK